MAQRLGYVNESAGVIEAEEAFKKYIPKDNWIEAHHLFLLYGRYYCLKSKPLCETCKLQNFCKYFKKKK